MKKSIQLSLLTAVFMLVTPCIQTARADDSLMWMDDGGNIYFADSVSNIPPHYRDQYIPRPKGPTTMEEYKHDLADFKAKQKAKEKADKLAAKEKLRVARKKEKDDEKERKRQIRLEKGIKSR